MKKPTIEQIHAAMQRVGMKVFKQPYSVTMGGVRTKDNAANTFNDWLFSSYFDAAGKIVSVVIPGTVDAGLTARIHPANKKGVAIIQDGVQHSGAYQYQNPSEDKNLRGHKGKEAFRQVKPMKIWRDNDRDALLEPGTNPEVSLSFTNGHDMGVLGKNVNNWSEGCWGSTEKNMDVLYSFARTQIAAELGDTFSFALLHENNF